MYVDPITQVKFNRQLSTEQILILEIFDNILIEMVSYGCISKVDILFLLCPNNSRDNKENKQEEIAQRLIHISKNSQFTKSVFDPWCFSFERHSEINDLLNDDIFWEKCPRFLRKKRGMLTGILRKYRSLMKNNQCPS